MKDFFNWFLKLKNKPPTTTPHGCAFKEIQLIVEIGDRLSLISWNKLSYELK